MFCSKCGRQLPKDSLFCPSCGSKIISNVVDDSQNLTKTEEHTDIVPIAESTKETAIEDIAVIEQEQEQAKEELTISKLITELKELDNAASIYNAVIEHGIDHEDLLDELKKTKEIERMYGNAKESALKKICKYYDFDETTGANSDLFVCYKPEKKQEELSIPSPEDNKADDETSVLWYYLSGKDRKGPVSDKYIEDLINNRSIERNTLVWKEGMSEWIKAENTSLNKLFQGVIPATPPSAISDRWLWALATVPIATNIILVQIFPTIPFILLTIIIIGLNILFLSLDTTNMRSNGYEPESWLWLGFILVPVYLFVRAAKTTKNYLPGIVWCILFGLDLFI